MSYSPVYSQGFIYYCGTTPNEQFAVPAGFTAVVRDYMAYSAAGDVDTNLYVQLSEAAPAIYCVGLHIVGINSSAQWTGRIVVPEGGLITIGISELGFYDGAYVGGYLLRNVLP